LCVRRLSGSQEMTLIEKAREAMQGAYSPYSGVKVGAAIMAEDGTIYSGANVENSSYGLTICAERTAAFKAVNSGARKFRAVAIAMNMEGMAYPCGACRQVLAEFSPEMIVILCDRKGRVERHHLEALLKYPFKLRPPS